MLSKEQCPFCGLAHLVLRSSSTSFSGGPNVRQFECGECLSRKVINSDTGTTYRRSGHPLSERYRIAQGTSAGTAETGTGSGLQPAGPVAESDAPKDQDCSASLKARGL